MKSCREICERAQAILDGTDDGADEELRAHLSLCPPCIEYVRQLGLTVEALRALPPEPAGAIRDELLARFDAWTASRGVPDAEPDPAEPEPAE
ncbi:MAG: anti-sigma factor [Myxococcota bacterium]